MNNLNEKPAKPILSLDFDGVIHQYDAPWKGAHIIEDGPVVGSMLFIWDASEHFRIAIHSSRSNQAGGINAMRKWLTKHFRDYWAADRTTCDDKLAEIIWATEKPPAMISLDDRAITFSGVFPDPKILLNFVPWNRERPPRLCSRCGVETDPPYTACYECRIIRRVNEATEVPSEGYALPVYSEDADGDWGDGYCSELAALHQYFEEIEGVVPCYVHPCRETVFRFDPSDILDRICDDHHEGASDQVVDWPDVLTFFEEWNAKQKIRSYAPDYNKVIVLDRDRFEALKSGGQDGAG